MPPALPPETGVGPVALNVRDLSGTSTFYQDVLGLRLCRQEAAQVHPGTLRQDLVVLYAAPGSPKTTQPHATPL